MRNGYLLLLLISANLSAATLPFPILEKRVGGKDRKDGLEIVKSCKVYEDHPSLNLSKVVELAREAEKVKLNYAAPFIPSDPSEELWVNVPEKMAGGPATTKIGTHKILLWETSEKLTAKRESKAADELLELIEQLCKAL